MLFRILEVEAIDGGLVAMEGGTGRLEEEKDVAGAAPVGAGGLGLDIGSVDTAKDGGPGALG